MLGLKVKVWWFSMVRCGQSCLVEQATVFRGGGCSSEIQLLERMKICTDYNI